MFLNKLRHIEGFPLAEGLPARTCVSSGSGTMWLSGGGTTCLDSSFTGVELSEAAVHNYLSLLTSLEISSLNGWSMEFLPGGARTGE